MEKRLFGFKKRLEQRLAPTFKDYLDIVDILDRIDKRLDRLESGLQRERNVRPARTKKVLKIVGKQECDGKVFDLHQVIEVPE